MSQPATSDRWRVYYEVAALCGHHEPADFANAMIRPPCAHHGPWFFDDEEICPDPCGQKHWWCAECLRPMSPECPILATADD